MTSDPIDEAAAKAIQDEVDPRTYPEAWKRPFILNAARAARLAILKAMREPTEDICEIGSRTHDPEAWEQIDKWIADDDWNGGTARNLRDSCIKTMRKAYVAMLDAEIRSLEVGDG